MRIKTNLLPIILCWAASMACAYAGTTDDWPDWDRFVDRFMQADGRIIDITYERKSTSEGQSYGLFFALVANQRTQFDSILKWTSDNLAAGQLGDKLPAWLWGLRADGNWGVKDQNSASDADLWLAYTLLEAGRLWQSPSYTATGHKLLALIQQHETARAGGSAGTVLLPGAIGFNLDSGRFRINPSYMPGFMFHYLAGADPNGPWQSMWDSYMQLAPQIFSARVAPDLYVVDSSGRVRADTEREPSGSYDAIRVYLWAGMSSDPDSQKQIKMLATYAALIRQYGAPPEKVNPLTGAATKTDYSPIGFSAAVLPFLKASGDNASLKKQYDRLLKKHSEPTQYYDQVLILFGKGWFDGQYRFDAQGKLQPKWLLTNAVIHAAVVVDADQK